MLEVFISSSCCFVFLGSIHTSQIFIYFPIFLHKCTSQVCRLFVYSSRQKRRCPASELEAFLSKVKYNSIANQVNLKSDFCGEHQLFHFMLIDSCGFLNILLELKCVHVWTKLKFEIFFCTRQETVLQTAFSTQVLK